MHVKMLCRPVGCSIQELPGCPPLHSMLQLGASEFQGAQGLAATVLVQALCHTVLASGGGCSTVQHAQNDWLEGASSSFVIVECWCAPGAASCLAQTSLVLASSCLRFTAHIVKSRTSNACVASSCLRVTAHILKSRTSHASVASSCLRFTSSRASPAMQVWTMGRSRSP